MKASPWRFTPAIVRRDASGRRRGFHVLVAEADRRVVGYASFVAGYNTDIAARELWMLDLFVAARWRGHGVGLALVRAVAGEASAAASRASSGACAATTPGPGASTADEILWLREDEYELIDLAGRTVVPGFVDPHNHFSIAALEVFWPDCRGLEETLPVEAALRAYTLDAARAAGLDRDRGSLVSGKRGDLVVLSQNPPECHPEAIKDVRVLQTWVRGVCLTGIARQCRRSMKTSS